MGANSKVLGKVKNTSMIQKDVSVADALLIVSGAAAGAYVGFIIGGPVGAAVGTLIGAFVGALAAGAIKNFRVKLYKDGTVEVHYETRFA